MIDQSSKILLEEDENSFVLMNTYRTHEGMINVPDSFHGYSIIDEEGEVVQPTKLEKDRSLCPSSLLSTFKKGKENNLDHCAKYTSV